MDSGEKPFPCKIDGCKLSFATEDHLEVHRKKHDMLLNLELPNKSNLFADQTPTPTRLIGKCEEVGLFEDLQNVNPFDETFRRAVEEKSVTVECEQPPNGEQEQVTSSAGQVIGGDDTLHTPHVFPLLERRESIKDRTYKLSKLIISRSVSKKDDAPVVQTEVRIAPAQIQAQSKVPASAGHKRPFVNILPKAVPPTQPSVIVTPCDTSNGTNPVKAKLKQHLFRNGSIVKQPSAVSEALPLPAKKAKPAEQEPVSSKDTHDAKDKNPKHERWKAAAKRYRTRVKQTQDSLHHKNIALEEENHRLKTELARMKNILSLHVDCSVTRALSSKVDSESAAAAGPSKAVQLPVVPIEAQQHPVVVPQTTTAVVMQQQQNPSSGRNAPVYIVLGGVPAMGLVKANLCSAEVKKM